MGCAQWRVTIIYFYGSPNPLRSFWRADCRCHPFLYSHRTWCSIIFPYLSLFVLIHISAPETLLRLAPPGWKCPSHSVAHLCLHTPHRVLSPTGSLSWLHRLLALVPQWCLSSLYHVWRPFCLRFHSELHESLSPFSFLILLNSIQLGTEQA